MAKRRSQGKSGSARPEQWLLQALGGGPTTAGVTVSPATALRSSVVYGCTNVISEDLAKLPFSLWRQRADGGWDEARQHPLWTLFNRRPNRLHTRFELKEMLQASLLLRGNAYTFKELDNAGNIVALWPIHPDRVTLLEASDGDLFYQVARGNAVERRILDGMPLNIPAELIWHLRAKTLSGYLGLSVIDMARETIGLQLAQEQHAAGLMGRGARPGGVIKNKSKMAPDVAQRLKAQWDAISGGLLNVGKTVVLEDGMEWQPLGMTQTDAQFIEQRGFQVLDILRFFRVPPHKVADLSRATFSNIENQEQAYINDTLMPWGERWEASADANLLTEKEQASGLCFAFDFDNLLRGDIRSRYEAYFRGRQGGWLSVNDVRRGEGMNPVEGGDTYERPLNMVDIRLPADSAASAPPPGRAESDRKDTGADNGPTAEAA